MLHSILTRRRILLVAGGAAATAAAIGVHHFASSDEETKRTIEVLTGIGTLILAVFIARFSYGAYRAAKSSAESAKTQLARMARPKLAVRNIRVPLNSDPLEGTIDVANVGDAAATIIAAHVEIHPRPSGDLPEMPMVDSDSDPAAPNVQLHQQAIQPGADLRLSIPATVPFAESDDTFPEFQAIKYMSEDSGGTATGNGLGTIYIVGYVTYRDSNEIRRTTRFCRQFNKFKRRYLVDEEADYEYAD